MKKNILKPFFCYYGGKYRIGLKYPRPVYNTIVEPFAGSAGYSIRHFEKNILLNDINKIICSIWRFLIDAHYKDIMGLPILKNNQSLDNFNLSNGEKYLIGFWLNKGTTNPSKTPSSWMRSGIRPNSYWCDIIKKRIADQVKYIKHWRIFNKSYIDLPNGNYTWFINPPYQNGGTHYKHKIDCYDNYAQWVKNRKGQIICCERSGANYLEFEKLTESKTNPSKRGSHKMQEIYYHSIKSTT